MKKKIKGYLLAVLVTIITLQTACTDDLDSLNPYLGKTVSINYFNAAQTLNAYDSRGAVVIFVDTVEFGASYSSSIVTAPYISIYDEYGSFPSSWKGDKNQSIYYLDYEAGEHGFIFSYQQNEYEAPVKQLAQGKISFEKGSHNMVYIADAPAVADGAKAEYVLVSTGQPLEKGVEDGKVSVRFVHLAPDLGNIDISQSRQNEEDGEIREGLPQNLAFGEMSDYLPIDTSELINNQLLFRIYKSGVTDQSAATSGVPASTGHSYEIVIHGFSKETTRQIVTGSYEEDGTTPQYKTISLTPALRTTVRQTY